MNAKLDAMEAAGEDISPIVTFDDVPVNIEGKVYMVAPEVAIIIYELSNELQNLRDSISDAISTTNLRDVLSKVVSE